MEWEYKNMTIAVDEDGMFKFRHQNEKYVCTTLKEAKSKIDLLCNEYYTFTQKDMNRLMKKLTEREQALVRSLYQEVEKHKENAYCEMGIMEDSWVWDWDFDK